MRPMRSAGPSAIYANILVNSSQQTLISFFEATLGKVSEWGQIFILDFALPFWW